MSVIIIIVLCHLSPSSYVLSLSDFFFSPLSLPHVILNVPLSCRQWDGGGRGRQGNCPCHFSSAEPATPGNAFRQYPYKQAKGKRKEKKKACCCASYMYTHTCTQRQQQQTNDADAAVAVVVTHFSAAPATQKDIRPAVMLVDSLFPPSSLLPIRTVGIRQRAEGL